MKKYIAKLHYEKNLNKYHVIQINMRDFLDKADRISGVIRQITEEVQFDVEEDLEGVRLRRPQDLSQICADIYRQTKTPFVFLIDEWDAVFRVKGWGSGNRRNT